MKNIRDIAATKLAQGYTHAVVVWYDYADKQRGDVISCHRSYEAAELKTRKDKAGVWGIRTLSEVV